MTLSNSASADRSPRGNYTPAAIERAANFLHDLNGIVGRCACVRKLGIDVRDMRNVAATPLANQSLVAKLLVQQRKDTSDPLTHLDAVECEKGMAGFVVVSVGAIPQSHDP